MCGPNVMLSWYNDMTYFCDCVLLISRVFDKESNEPDESIKSVETLCPDQGWAVVLLGEGAVAEVHAHLGGHAEEPGDQVVRLQQTVEVHLLDEDGEGLGGVLACSRRVIHVDPFSQQEFCLLQQSWRIIKFSGLLNSTVQLSCWAGHG